MGGFWAGVDIGTSGVKTVLIDEGGAVVADASAPLDVSRPRPGWSEQAPDDWVEAAIATLDRLSRSAPEAMRDLRGLGLSGQMHGATLLGEDARPLRPAMLWNDGRSAAECDALEAAADFRGVAGNLVMPGFTAPKIEWLRRREPEIFGRIAMVLLPKDYVRLALTGEHVTDMSDASGTLWLDVAARAWSPELLAATGLERGQMPSLVEGSDPGGSLRRSLRERWGVAGEVVVAGGGGDNAAAACGVGAVRPGTGFVSLGTSGVLFACNERFSPDPARAVHAFCHALPETWHQMGVILAATDSLNWLARIAGRDAAELAAAAEGVEAGSDAPLFLPYLSGERTPHNDAAARAAFAGLSASAGPEDLARAVLEGVAFAFADCRAVLEAAGARLERVFAVGGGARSAFWLRLVADAAGIALERLRGGELGAAYGAARLGFCAAEGARPEEVCRPAEAELVVEPDAARAALSAERLAAWRSLYPAAARPHAPPSEGPARGEGARRP